MSSTNTSHIKLIIGQMLVDDDYRKDNSGMIPLDNITVTDLFIIAKALQEDDFSLTDLYMKHNKRIISLATDCVKQYAKMRVEKYGKITNE